MDLLARHVAALKAGVSTGNFASMVELFAPDAKMIFENIPVGPFHGREAIAEAYAAHPPDDGILILRSQATDGGWFAQYAWLSSPTVRGGDLEILSRDGLIQRLTITYGGNPDRWSD